jgi:hypothetical protein
VNLQVGETDEKDAGRAQARLFERLPATPNPLQSCQVSRRASFDTPSNLSGAGCMPVSNPAGRPHTGIAQGGASAAGMPEHSAAARRPLPFQLLPPARPPFAPHCTTPSHSMW